jgi:hypothetical protein
MQRIILSDEGAPLAMGAFDVYKIRIHRDFMVDKKK